MRDGNCRDVMSSDMTRAGGAKIVESSKHSAEKDTCPDSRPIGLDSVVSAQLGTLGYP